MTSIFEIQCFLTMFDQPTIWSVVGIPNFFRKRNFKESVSMKRGRDTKLSQEEKFQKKCKGKKI
jgi:hypothetical protein